MKSEYIKKQQKIKVEVLKPGVAITAKEDSELEYFSSSTSRKELRKEHRLIYIRQL